MNTEQAEAPARRTRFSDVCGTIDELKRLLHQEPESSVAQPQVLESLIDDALFMEARMEVRLKQYRGHFLTHARPSQEWARTRLGERMRSGRPASGAARATMTTPA
jgi:hypothetical protein